MSNEQALLDCTFGWGKTCRLYLDSIEIAGKSYSLDDLTAIQPTYRNIFGVPSARLELFFGLHRLVLRGIPDPEVARQMVAFLRPYCSVEPRSRLRTAKSRCIAREQARTWERSLKLPAIPASPEENTHPRHVSKSLKHSTCGEDSSFTTSFDDDDLAQAARVVDDSLPGLEALPSATDEQEQDTSLSARDEVWSLTRARPLRTPRFQPPLRSVHLVAPGQKMHDTCSVPVPVVKSSVLPVIHVPVRLQPGECAHYSIGASLCSDRISGSDRAPYPPLDHGLLILTNRRIFYIGKRSQLVLAYTHLWYVSLLHNAIALHIEQQFRRIIIELEHPQEWASRIEQLSFIARRARPRPELPTLLMAALPGLPSSSLDAATLKRPTVKVPAPKAQEETETPPAAPDMLLLPERVDSESAEAPTVSLTGEPGQHCADMKTQDFPTSPERTENTAQETASQPDFAQRTTPEEILQPAALTNATTQDLLQAADPTETVTQELRRAGELADITTQELCLAPADSRGEYEATQSNEGEVTTSTLCDSAIAGAWDDRDYEEVETLPLRGRTDELEDGEAQTISLRDRRATRTNKPVQEAPVSDKLPDIEITPRRLPRVRRVRQLTHRHEEN